MSERYLIYGTDQPVLTQVYDAGVPLTLGKIADRLNEAERLREFEESLAYCEGCDSYRIPRKGSKSCPNCDGAERLRAVVDGEIAWRERDIEDWKQQAELGGEMVAAVAKEHIRLLEEHIAKFKAALSPPPEDAT